MESALGWLGDLFQFLFSLFPRLVIVRSTHGAVCWKRGKNPVEWEPGLHIYWPLVSEYWQYPVVDQTLPKKTQTTTTKDGKVVEVSAVVLYRVADVKKLLTSIVAVEETLADLYQLVIRRNVGKLTFDELVRSPEQIDKSLTEAYKEYADRYGICIIDVAFSDVAPTFSVKLWSANASAELAGAETIE